MMIDFALEASARKDVRRPTRSCTPCLIRFRPIMMTTMAALMGTLPIACLDRRRCRVRRPLGVAVVGGLAFSQLITLYVTPVFYTYMDSLNNRLTRGFARLGKKKVVEPKPVPVPKGAVAIERPDVAAGD
jgi:HAE1 family hydrophobic/amphiphilic exporter-1